MKVMLKKLLITVLLTVFIAVNFLAFFPSKATAQGVSPWYSQSFQQWYTKVYDEDVSPPSEIFGERYTAAQVQWVIYGLFAFIINSATNTEALTCLMNGDLSACGDIIKGMLSFNPVDDDALAGSQNGSFLAAVFTDRPLSGITYFKEKARDLHLVPEVKAQGAGFGFDGLELVLELWKAARNITYVLFIFVIIVMAFMIMFRVKISPQTVISVQSALPKLAAAIILVTFSYAIAGFLIDIMYIVYGIISLMLAKTSILFSDKPLTMFEFLTKGTIAGFDIGVGGLLFVYLLLFGIALFMVLLFGNGLLFTLVEGLITFGTGPALYILISLVVFVVLLIVILFAALKITWMLIKAFANVLLLTIFAPFQIVLGTLTSGGGFSAWLKNYASHLAVFPVTSILFALAFIFLLQAVNNVGEGIWNLPSSILAIFKVGPLSVLQTQTGWPPLLGTSDKMMSLLLLGVSLGILLIIPKAADLIKGLITGKPLAYGTAIGEAFGPVGAAYGQFGAPIVRPIREAYTSQKLYNAFDTLAKKYPRSGILDTITKGMESKRKP